MAESFTANAVYAKAHALYGKRLKKQNYEDLLNCRSLPELVNYLKTRTSYGSTFLNTPSDISTQQIQELLRLHLLEDFEAISRYEISAGDNFYQYFIVKNDIKQILGFIRLLIIGRPEKYLADLPAFFNKHSQLDLYKMAKSDSFGGLLEALDDTEYRELLVPFSDIYKDKGAYIRIEAALNGYLKKYLYGVVTKGQSRKAKKEIHEIVSYKFDMDAIVSIYRLIRLADADEELIKSCVSTEFTNFSQEEIDMLIDAPRARDMMRLMPETYYKKDFAKTEYTYLEGTAQSVLYRKVSKCMRTFTNPTAVMLCFVILSENEVQNIIRITEGIKYNIPSKKTVDILIGAE